MMEKAAATIAWLGAVVLMVNGALMMLVPLAWYNAVPGVSGTGPFNAHFIIDIGMIYATTAIGYALGAAWRGQRVGLWLMATLWLFAHALFHFAIALQGQTTAQILMRDFAGVTLPAIVGALLSIQAFRRQPVTEQKA